MIMKTKISHRFLSLFAAVLVAFSLISTVALAAEVQPRIPSCPNGCMGNMHYEYVSKQPDWDNPVGMCPKGGGNHYMICDFAYSVCDVCGNREVYNKTFTGKFYCRNGCF